MPRAFAAYILCIVFDDQTKSYHGPFFTEDRAKRYVEGQREIVDFTIEPLVIPYHLRVNIDE
jgi:hypothetical protein